VCVCVCVCVCVRSCQSVCLSMTLYLRLSSDCRVRLHAHPLSTPSLFYLQIWALCSQGHRQESMCPPSCHMECVRGGNGDENRRRTRHKNEHTQCFAAHTPARSHALIYRQRVFVEQFSELVATSCTCNIRDHICVAHSIARFEGCGINHMQVPGAVLSDMIERVANRMQSRALFHSKSSVGGTVNVAHDHNPPPLQSLIEHYVARRRWVHELDVTRSACRRHDTPLITTDPMSSALEPIIPAAATLLSCPQRGLQPEGRYWAHTLHSTGAGACLPVLLSYLIEELLWFFPRTFSPRPCTS